MNILMNENSYCNILITSKHFPITSNNGLQLVNVYWFIFYINLLEVIIVEKSIVIVDVATEEKILGKEALIWLRLWLVYH